MDFAQIFTEPVYSTLYTRFNFGIDPDWDMDPETG